MNLTRSGKLFFLFVYFIIFISQFKPKTFKTIKNNYKC